jgi:predicted aminopeptidase
MPLPLSRWRRRITAGLAACTLMLAGCDTLSYYGQAVAGHWQLISRARPVADWLADPLTPPVLHERLRISQQMRDFAIRELKLPDNPSYRRYADIGRPYVVWNVVAAPALSLALKTWCFPLMGCVGYRGYFDARDAEALAATLRGQGWEVQVYGVPAYSTLGWSNIIGGDPLLNTFVSGAETELARLVFHELAHQVVYVADDTAFNESFATAVERIGVGRWLDFRADEALRATHRAHEGRAADFQARVARARAALQAVYDSAASDDDKHAAKGRIFAELRDGAAAAPWAADARWRAWFDQANNASLAIQSAYAAQVPDFERLFDRQGRDFDRFYAEVRRIAALPRPERATALGNP